MALKTCLLTDADCRNAKPPTDSGKLALKDGGSLFLVLMSYGGKLWQYRYRFHGKANIFSIGAYPDVSLKEARKRRDAARELLDQGIDPNQQKKQVKLAGAERAANSLEVVAREWYLKNKPVWSESHGDRIIRRLERDVFPWLGGRPIDQLEAPELLQTARRIESRGAIETAHRALQDCGSVFRYAIATGRAVRNPVPDLKGALQPVRETHFATITDPARVGEMLRAFDGFKGTFVVQAALRLAPLLFCRPGELRQAKWSDFDLDAGEWRYITSKTKTEHLVPLSRQAVAILRELYPLTGHSEWVFPGARTNGKAMSEAAINAALRRMGFDTKTEITGHGFRAMARTLLHERLGMNPAAIEHQLAHAVPDALGTAYNRTKFLDERRQMMQAWADYLDKLKAGAGLKATPRQE